MRKEGHTSQFSRIKQRPPATDLSGPKASAESLTPRRSNFAVADAVDLQPGLLPPATALGLPLLSGRGTFDPWSRKVNMPALSEGTIRGSN